MINSDWLAAILVLMTQVVMTHKTNIPFIYNRDPTSTKADLTCSHSFKLEKIPKMKLIILAKKFKILIKNGLYYFVFR